MARPTKEKQDLRTRYISIRLTEDEYAKIKKKAQQSNREISTYSRETLLKGVVVQKDLITPQLLSSLGRVGNNVNQIAQRVNHAGNIRLTEIESGIIEDIRNLLRQIAEEISK